MRTTLTLDDDLVRKIKELAHRRGQSFKQALNEALRRGLAGGAGRRSHRYTLEPHSGGFRPGIDPGKLNQLADELEVEDFVGEASR